MVSGEKKTKNKKIRKSIGNIDPNYRKNTLSQEIINDEKC